MGTFKYAVIHINSEHFIYILRTSDCFSTRDAITKSPRVAVLLYTRV
jgi:hypothetical protein